MNIAPIIPEITMAIAAMVWLLVGVFTNQKQAGNIAAGVILTMVVTIFQLTKHAMTPAILFHDMFQTNEFIVVIKILILIASMLAILLSNNYLQQNKIDHFEYPILIMIATLGMMIMVSSYNLISTYLGLELQSLSLYVLAAIHRRNVKSNEAGLKYFVLGALASGFLLYGCSLLYGVSGTTSFAGLEEVLSQENSIGAVLGIVFVVAGLAFKISAVPFHMWTPDVYEGAPTPVTGFFAMAPKLAALGLFANILTGPMINQAHDWQQLLWVLSVGSMFVGALGALRQTNIKRLLAYSSIGHMGYALIGLIVLSSDGIQALLIYMSIYIVMTAGVFALVMMAQKNKQETQDIESWAGMSKTNPVVAGLMAVLMFSMAGIPPLAGFFAKFYIFMAAIKQEFYVLSVLGVISSVIAAYYYLRIIKVMYMDKPHQNITIESSFALKWIAYASGMAVIFFILIPGTLWQTSWMAAQALALK